MKYVDQFRKANSVKKLVEAIHQVTHHPWHGPSRSLKPLTLRPLIGRLHPGNFFGTFLLAQEARLKFLFAMARRLFKYAYQQTK